jgi:hypothetical protein
MKLWSETNPSALKVLKPDFGLRSWNDLSTKEKERIFRYLHTYAVFDHPREIVQTIAFLTHKYLGGGYGEALLNHFGPHFDEFNIAKSCCNEPATNDFIKIVMKEDENVVFETFSIYSHTLIYIARDSSKRNSIIHDEVSEDFNKAINYCFEQFGIGYRLTREGFIPIQESKIIEEVYTPVLCALGDNKWKSVSREFSQAFEEYRKKTKEGFSSSLTHTINALQGYLQILIEGKTGGNQISKLIPIGINNGLLPNDEFSKKTFDLIESTEARLRKEKGDAHPKDEFASEHDARLALDLSMVFIRHSISYRK